MITKEQLAEFKKIYKKQFGKDISDREALESATSLINLMRIIYKPMTKKEFARIERKMKEHSK